MMKRIFIHQLFLKYPLSLPCFTMKNADILIIGAGAAGLMAAHELSKAGKRVIILEAQNRIGGRIYTLDDTSFLKYAELGAEFVHGDLPVTLQLPKESEIEM